MFFEKEGRSRYQEVVSNPNSETVDIRDKAIYQTIWISYVPVTRGDRNIRNPNCLNFGDMLLHVQLE